MCLDGTGFIRGPFSFDWYILHDVMDLFGRAQVKGRLVIVLGVLDDLMIANTSSISLRCQMFCGHERAHSHHLSIEDDSLR